MIIVLIIVVSTLQWLIAAWGLMMVVGAIHSDWLHNVPTLSYGSALDVTFWLYIALTGFSLLNSFTED